MTVVNLYGGPRIREIIFRFHVSQWKYLPLGSEYRPVTDHVPGIVVVADKDRSGLADVLKAMDADYVLIDAFFGPSDLGGHIASFTLCRKEYVKATERSLAQYQKSYNELWAFCKDALWSVRVYSDHYMQDGRPVPDVGSVVIRCEKRRALFDEDGRRVMVWPCDESGNYRPGSNKMPLAPENVFQLVDQTCELAAVN